eukprot:150530-Rhodomonas_salina.1
MVSGYTYLYLPEQEFLPPGYPGPGTAGSPGRVSAGCIFLVLASSSSIQSPTALKTQRPLTPSRSRTRDQNAHNPGLPGYLATLQTVGEAPPRLKESQHNSC